MAPKGPYKLCTVNTAPERAKLVVGRVVDALKERYTVIHVENVGKIEDVKAMCERNRPDLLFCASMWTKEESDEIQQIAQDTVPGIKTMAIPQGLQAGKGPDAVVEYVSERLPELIEK